jgi:nucleotide-binding universal stress UspA family protein
MGTRGHHEKLEQTIGTHATDVIDATDIPVLVIPEETTSFKLKTIGFASDFSKNRDMEEYRILHWIAELFHAKIMIFHILDQKSKVKEEEELLGKRFEQKFGNVKRSIHIIESKSVVDGIKDFVETNNLDLLALLPRNHNLFSRIFKRSVTRSIATDPKVPVLAFHLPG